MFEGLFQPMHLLVVLIIAMLIFGPKRLAELGKGLGDGIRSFKGAMREPDNAAEPRSLPSTTANSETVKQPLS